MKDEVENIVELAKAEQVKRITAKDRGTKKKPPAPKDS
jgi:hypothetical protein